MAVIALLAGTNVLMYFSSEYVSLVVGPLVASVLLMVARRAGLSWDDLGMTRRAWRKGALYASIIVALVALVYVLGAALPVTRSAFLDVRYHMGISSALITALVLIPLGTVLLEEIAFRGVLFGLFRRIHGRWAAVLSSGVFGVWHILPSLGLTKANSAVGATLGSGGGPQLVAIMGAVVFTIIAGLLFCELRRRSGSLLAAAGLHWATNGLGVLVGALLWSWSS